MKPMSLIALFCGITLVTIPCLARPKKEKEPKYQAHQKVENEEETDDQSDDEHSPLVSDHHYRPNPVILAGVGQIMNGALQIAQNPHSRPNLGHSIASMIYGIMSIVVEKVANKKIDISNTENLEECFNELSAIISKEITEIIITKRL